MQPLLATLQWGEAEQHGLLLLTLRLLRTCLNRLPSPIPASCASCLGELAGVLIRLADQRYRAVPPDSLSVQARFSVQCNSAPSSRCFAAADRGDSPVPVQATAHHPLGEAGPAFASRCPDEATLPALQDRLEVGKSDGSAYLPRDLGQSRDSRGSGNSAEVQIRRDYGTNHAEMSGRSTPIGSNFESESGPRESSTEFEDGNETAPRSPGYHSQEAASLVLDVAEKLVRMLVLRQDGAHQESNPLPLTGDLTWRARLLLVHTSNPCPDAIPAAYLPPSLHPSREVPNLATPDTCLRLFQDALCFVASSDAAAQALGEALSASFSQASANLPTASEASLPTGSGRRGSPGDPGTERSIGATASPTLERCNQNLDKGSSRFRTLVGGVAELLAEHLRSASVDSCQQALVTSVAQIVPSCTAREFDRCATAP